MAEKVFPLKTGMKVFCWIMGIICIPLIITIPFAVMMIMMATRARLEIHPDKAVAVWLRTREIPFAEVTKWEWGNRNARGLLGMMMGTPVHYYNREDKKVFWGIMVEAYKDTPGILAALEEKTGFRP